MFVRTHRMLDYQRKNSDMVGTEGEAFSKSSAFCHKLAGYRPLLV